MTDMIGSARPPAPQPGAQRSDSPLWQVTQQLERAFLSEMLKSAGVGTPRASFGGGVGEEQFASYLREAHAGEIVKAGGIGLAERLFEVLKADRHDA